jgi:DNA polymerase-3 subunit alpha
VTQALFHEPPVDFKLPQLSSSPLDDMIDQIELLGFPLDNIFKIAGEDAFQYSLARNLPQMLGSEITMLLYFVTNKPFEQSPEQ